MSQRVLLVEDEQNILDALKANLELEGYHVVCETNGLAALKTFEQESFDLVVLDIMIPEVDGLEVCEVIRLKDRETPILFLTARDTSSDIVTGLKKGADDYLTKPFNLEEFLLRVKNLLRRSPRSAGGIETDVYRFEENEINFKTFEARHRSRRFQLTKKEALLLKLLIERRNEVVSRELILKTVWGYDVYPSTRTIDNFIVALRKYFEEDPKAPRLIQSVRGIGYRFSHEPN